MLAESRTGWRYLAQPVVQMLANEAVVVQIWICRVDQVNLLHLSARKIFLRLEAPAPLEQSLAPEDFMQSRDASPKMIRRIKNAALLSVTCTPVP
jgi:hypothetical protein